MWIRNLKTFAKHLQNNKIYTIVTVLGFAISLTFVILLSVYINNELAVNSNHINNKRIFRLTSERGDGFAPPIGDLLQNELPEIESYTRTYRNDAIVAYDNGQKLKMEFLMADSTFFNIFSFNLIEGDAETALKTKNSVVLSAEFARKLFGNKSPVGKKIILNDNINCTVTGVVEDISKHSNFKKCDAIVNFRCLIDLWGYDGFMHDNSNCSFGLYLLAKQNTNLPKKASHVLEIFKKDLWLYSEGRVKTVIFEPLSDVYFSQINANAMVHNSKTLLMVLSAIVTLILVLAIINYMNLTIAQSGLRIKETAIKKVVGSSRKGLIMQYINESVVLCLISFSLATFLSFLAQPFFNKLLNSNISLVSVFESKIIIMALLIVVLIGIFSGIIPALIITKLNALEVIKGGFRRKSKGIYSRILISFQYIVVIVLLIATLIISKQTQFLETHYLGFNTTNVIWFDSNTDLTGDTGLKSKLKSVAGVKEVSFVMGSPMDGGNNQSFIYNELAVSFQEFVVDSAFFNIMDFQIEYTGIAYSKDAIYLNKNAIKTLSLDSLPEKFKRYGQVVPVLGVINDFNYGSLHKNIGPIMVRQLTSNDFPWNIIIQIEGKNASSTIEQIGNVYSNFTGGQPFQPRFFDETISSWYEREKRTSKIVGYFTLLTIIIAVMGIFAMSIFYIQQKIKEIGIRKVNGAKVGEIIEMLNRDFIIWVVAAFIIASPLAFFAMHKWLQNFAYKTEISWWIFALSGFIALSIALLTVSWQTFRAARRNPVEALRYE